VTVPAYDRSALEPRIVHLGVGGFHRAHMALYTDDIAADGSLWGIVGLGILDSDNRMADALRPQDHLYTLTERASDSSTTRVIGSIVDFVVVDSAARGARRLLADPQTSILSLTITESGYSAPSTTTRRTTFDVIADCLDARRSANAGPITILSCDNLPGNGDVARAATIAAAQRHSTTLLDWVTSHCSFPNSMVDRITPVTSDADRQWLLHEFGIIDRWPVVAEPFRQWVVEDHFMAGRPSWEDAGVLFSGDVHAWELYKLRLLNAGHSTIAYLSALAGIIHVDEALATPAVRNFLEALLLTEAVPTLTVIPGHPREEYVRTVLGRFASRGVRDQIARLCIDGTAKFPTFLVPTIERQLELGGPVQLSALALAGWARYLATVPESDQAFDAIGDRSRTLARASLGDPKRFLELNEVFPDALRSNERFQRAFDDAAHALDSLGPLRAMIACTPT
jgi:mannitol 2-dehydrogenase